MTSDDFTRSVSRRQLLAVSGAAVGSAALGVVPTTISSADESAAIEYVDAELAAAPVEGDYDESYCRVGSTLASELGVDEGMQLRVAADDPASGVDFSEKLFTVTDVVADDTGRITARRSDLDAIGASHGDAGRASATVPHPAYDDESEADEHDEFVESVTNEHLAGSSDVVALAPHGTYIEAGTGRQAAHVASEFEIPGWACYGYNDGGGAYRRWHVTSTEIEPRSFPMLNEIASHHYDAAIAFHGQSDDHVTVGGAAADLRRAVGSALLEEFDDEDLTVEVVDDGENAGVSPDNVVNAITCDDESGVQIEQPSVVRDDEVVASRLAETVVQTVLSEL